MTYDQQCEECRVPWLWELMYLKNSRERFSTPVLEALSNLNVADNRNFNQLCGLAFQYARSGNREFRNRLYEIVQSKPDPSFPGPGENEILELDGLGGLAFVVASRGKQISRNGWNRENDSLISMAIERFGKPAVESLIRDSKDADVNRFFDAWQSCVDNKPASKPNPSHRDRMRSRTAHQAIEAARSKDRCHWLIGWGRHADRDALQIVMDELLNKNEPEFIKRMLRTFVRAPLPNFDSRFLEFCNHNDEEIRRVAVRAVQNNKHADIRKTAIAWLGADRLDEAIPLLVANYEQGDEHRILDVLEIPDDADEVHSLVIGLIDLLEKNPIANCPELALTAYAESPCSLCRRSAARLLINWKTAPVWLLHELRHDAETGCRDLLSS